jgi:hypothetical protein
VYLCPEEGLEDASPVKSTTTPRKECSHHPLGHTATTSPAMAPPQYTTIKQEVKQEPMEGKAELGGLVIDTAEVHIMWFTDLISLSVSPLSFSLSVSLSVSPLFLSRSLLSRSLSPS